VAPEGGFLGRLPKADAEALIALSRRRAYRTGDTLFREGDDGTALVLLLEGIVKISMVSTGGREVALEVRGAGEIVGELSAIDGLPRSATATALAPVTVVSIRHSEFQSFLAAHPVVSSELLKLLASRVRTASRRQLEFGATDALARICARLLELAAIGEGAPPSQPIDVQVPMTQSDLAAWLGLSREAVVKALKSLRELGWIEVNGRTFTLIDVPALRARARM
jgi:CRP/FNR family cyclic AMP-dependent transcriptional regulator